VSSLLLAYSFGSSSLHDATNTLKHSSLIDQFVTFFLLIDQSNALSPSLLLFIFILKLTKFRNFVNLPPEDSFEMQNILNKRAYICSFSKQFPIFFLN